MCAILSESYHDKAIAELTAEMRVISREADLIIAKMQSDIEAAQHWHESQSNYI